MHSGKISESSRAPLSTLEPLVSVRDVSKRFCRDPNRSLRYMALDAMHDLFARSNNRATLRAGEFWALRNISFDVARGQSLGVMGLNGAGKSTLLKLMLGTLRVSKGEIVVSGRLAMLSEHGLGFDPMLSGRENVYLAAAVLGINRRRVNQAFDDIVAFAELEDFIDSPVGGYSSGMRARLGFSVAMYLEPDVLLVDEVLAVGDIGFQRRCIQHAQRFLERGGSLVLVSHNPHLVQFICDRCLVLDRGTLVLNGDVVEGVAQYLRATRTSPDDTLALDPSLSAGPSPCPAPVSDCVHIDDFGVQPVGCTSLRTAEAASVWVRYRATQDVTIRWGFSLLSADLATAITSEGLMKSVRILAGHGGVAATIQRLPLVAGRYALRVAMMDPETGLPFALGGFHSPPRYFTVDAATSMRNNYRMYTHDLIVLDDVKWEQYEVNEVKVASAI